MNPSAKTFNPHLNPNHPFVIPANGLTKVEHNTLKVILQEWSNAPSLNALLNIWSDHRIKSTALMNSCHNISFLLLNVASLKRYLVEVFNLIQSTSAPIIILNGTFHDDVTTKRFASFSFNYNVFTCRGTNAFGGVLVAIHKSIQCRRRDEFNHVYNLIVLELGSGVDVFQLVS